LTDQLPPDYLNHFHLTDQLPPDYLNVFHLTDVLLATNINVSHLSEVLFPAKNKQIHTADNLKAVYLSDLKYLRILNPTYLNVLIAVDNLQPLHHSIDSLKISNIIQPIARPNALFYIKLLNYIKRPNRFVVKDVKNEYKFVKSGFPANITEYGCEEADYFSTMQEAKDAALLKGYDEASIVITSISDDCYVWGTVNEPSTACPEDDYIRGYVHGG